MNKIYSLNKLKLAIVLVTLGVVFIFGWTIYSNQFSAVNPNEDSLLGPGEGDDYAVLYNFNNLYNFIEQNDDVLKQVQDDLYKFARTTIPNLSREDSLVAFTFSDKVEESDETSVYYGKFYDSDDEIKISITSQGRGVYTLSILNTANDTSIDDGLSLNGKRNDFIKSLPIEKSRYSIRYLLPSDRVVVSFYEGFSAVDISEVETTLQSALGEQYTSDVIFSVNTIGTFTLDEIRTQVN